MCVQTKVYTFICFGLFFYYTEIINTHVHRCPKLICTLCFIVIYEHKMALESERFMSITHKRQNKNTSKHSLQGVAAQYISFTQCFRATCYYMTYIISQSINININRVNWDFVLTMWDGIHSEIFNYIANNPYSSPFIG